MLSLPSLHEANGFLLCPTHCLSSPLAQEVCTGSPVLATEGLAHEAASSPATCHHHQPVREGGNTPSAEPRWTYPCDLLVSDVFWRSSLWHRAGSARAASVSLGHKSILGGCMDMNSAVFREEGFPVEAGWMQHLWTRSS